MLEGCRAHQVRKQATSFFERVVVGCSVVGSCSCWYLHVPVEHVACVHVLEGFQQLVEDVLLVDLLQDVGPDHGVQIGFFVGGRRVPHDQNSKSPGLFDMLVLLGGGG